MRTGVKGRIRIRGVSMSVKDVFSSARPAMAVVAVLAILTGCQNWPDARYVTPGAAALEVLAPVTIPANRARAHFQHGGPVFSVDAYEPYCELEISTVAEQPQRVERDVFLVRRVTTAILSDPEARLPLSGPFVDIDCGDRVYYEVAYRLASDLQPGVRKLSCRRAVNACWPGGGYPYLEEIRAALGPGFELR